jgi:hypothetical protein
MLAPLLTACPAPVDPVDFSAYQPILMSRAQLESSVSKKDPRPISKPGKLYRYGHYILINEQYRGVHLINNQNPESPVPVAFIQVPGSVDFAVKENILYVDNAVDLVALDIHDESNIRVVHRIRDAFPKLMPPDNRPADYEMAGAPQDAVVVGWEKKQTE